jgi:hypothetical protein
MLIRFLRFGLPFGLALAVPAATVACGAAISNDAPILDSVEAPLVVSEQNGSYAIPVSLLFHDNDGEAVTRLRYRLAPNIDETVDVPAPNPSRQSAEVTIVIKAADLDGDTSDDVSVRGANQEDARRAQDDREQGRGHDRRRARALQLTIVDGRGAESRPLTSTVTLN